MTKIKILRNEFITEIKCEGHSGYGVAGQDIVCSAISVLVQTWRDYCEQNNILLASETRDGYLMVICTENGYNRHAEAMKFLILGLESIKNAYPENLSLEWGEISML